MVRYDRRIITVMLLIHMIGFGIFYYSLRKPEIPQRNNAYITFTNADSYAKGVVGLATSLLDVKSKYPLVVLVTEEVSPSMRRLLESVKCIIRETQILPLPSELSLEVKRWGPAFTKLRAFEMVEYDKLVWLDSDLLVARF